MGIELYENRRAHLGAFVRLNEDWIRRYFELEAADYALAENPGGIIDDGGYIFSIVEDGEVVGVCALFYKELAVYELARMAVAPQHQGRGFADFLMQAALHKLTALGAKKVTLVSNTMLVPALALYRKHGFKVVGEGQDPNYARANIAMEKRLGALSHID